jgi:hypothetical protein
MSTNLSDGSILPVGLHDTHTNPSAFNSDPVLRLGSVKAIYYPDDDGNQSKEFIEYDILTEYVNSEGYYYQMLYPRCRQMSLFGGSADFSTFTLRQSTVANNQTFNQDQGSTVLLLSLNADRRQGVIIGGLNSSLIDKNQFFQQLEKDGHNYFWMFNGASIKVEDNGSIQISFQGATDDLGKPKVDTGGSFFLLDSQGNAGIESAKGSYIKAGSDGTISMQAQNTSNVILKSDGSTGEIGTGSSILMDVNQGFVEIKPVAGLKVGAATDYMLLGQSYRIAQGALDQSLVAQLNIAFAALTAASAALITASTPATLSFSAAQPLLATAGTSLATVGAALASIAASIESFESQTYLSIHNTSD